MYSHPTLIWANFTDIPSATKALARLQQLGFGSGQIAVQKRFQDALSGVDWSHTFYVRLPEGIVGGFAAGAVAAILLSFYMSRGFPQLLSFAAFTVGGMLLGAMLGALCGFAYALAEPMFRPSEESANENSISIGVQCLTVEAESQVREEMQQLGAWSLEN